MGFIRQIKETAVELFFPRRCPLCGALIQYNERICSRCAKDMVFIRRPICRKCGRPLGTCDCGRERYAYTRNVSPLIYTRAARRGIHRMKFRNVPSSCRYFGKLMACVVRSEYLDADIRIDCVIGVPMHPEEQRKRGYNQANLLAETVASELELPYLNRVLVKYRRNQKQHMLSLVERRKNIKDVFRVARPEAVAGKTVLLCDDVTTSGSTINECTLMLLNAGAKEVYCVTATVAVLSEMPPMQTAENN